jgi:hypothetical protein
VKMCSPVTSPITFPVHVLGGMALMRHPFLYFGGARTLTSVQFAPMRVLVISSSLRQFGVPKDCQAVGAFGGWVPLVYLRHPKAQA